MPATRSIGRLLAMVAIALAGAGLVVAICTVGLDAQSVTGRDYIVYWASERVLLSGGNPYDFAQMLHVQQAAGMTNAEAKITPSPPVAFFLALPLGLLSAKTGLIVWLLVSIACVCLSTLLLWQLFGRPSTCYHLFALMFPPVLSCLMAGQLGIFFLIGVVLFLRFIRTRPWLAGAALLPCALKPHLFLPLGAVLLLWSLRRKDLRALAGFFITVAVSCTLTLWVNPHIWAQYRQTMQASNVVQSFTPTVSMALLFAIDRNAHWIEFVPVVVACIWAAGYFWRRSIDWDWSREGMLLLLVSMAATPYSWYSDQAVLLPAVLAAIYAAEKKPLSWVLLALITIGGMIGITQAIDLTSPFYIWTAPAWLAWYVIAMRGTGEAAASSQPPNA